MEVRNMTKQATMCVRTTTTQAEIPQTLGAAYGEIMQFAGKHGIEPAGAPYTRFKNMDPQAMDVEIGFPTPGPVTGEGRVEGGEIPSERAVVAMHVGPYDTLKDTYGKLTAFTKEQGLEPTGECFEIYISDPDSTPPEELKTEVYFPVKA